MKLQVEKILDRRQDFLPFIFFHFKKYVILNFSFEKLLRKNLLPVKTL